MTWPITWTCIKVVSIYRSSDLRSNMLFACLRYILWAYCIAHRGYDWFSSVCNIPLSDCGFNFDWALFSCDIKVGKTSWKPWWWCQHWWVSFPFSIPMVPSSVLNGYFSFAFSRIPSYYGIRVCLWHETRWWNLAIPIFSFYTYMPNSETYHTF